MSTHRGIVLGSVLPPVPQVVVPSHRFILDRATEAFVPDETAKPTVAPAREDSFRWVAPPEDWFLRVAQTDPSDLDAVTAAVNRFGSFGVDRELNLDGLRLDPYVSGRGLSLERYLSAEQRRLVVDARPRAERASRLNRTVFVESKASIVAGIGLLKTMLELWERIEAGPRWRDGPRLAFMLDEGLKAFAPRVNFVSPADDDLDSRIGHADFAPLFHVLILQMAHAIAKDWRDVRTCADDRCGKLFCKQEGRATVRSPRNDSRFCSHVCARRFHQRNYRKQKRSAEQQ